MGPDGTSWHLGKWCKKGQNKGSTGLLSGSQASNVKSGDLIAVGADGRGGQIKVMRSLDQSSLVSCFQLLIDFVNLTYAHLFQL